MTHNYYKTPFTRYKNYSYEISKIKIFPSMKKKIIGVHFSIIEIFEESTSESILT